MKWILYLLVLANAAFFAWQYQLRVAVRASCSPRLQREVGSQGPPGRGKRRRSDPPQRARQQRVWKRRVRKRRVRKRRVR